MYHDVWYSVFDSILRHKYNKHSANTYKYSSSAIIGHATTVQYIITPEHVAILVLKNVS